jgi:predicted permease
VRPLREYLMGDVRPVVLLLLGAVGLLLFMATANVAALLLARMADRTTEMDVRASLGAGRGRLARQVFAETVLLAVIAGVAGGALALVSFDLLIGRLPLRDGFTSTLRLEWPVLIGGVALAAVAGVIVALAPMRRLLAGAGPTLHGSRSQTGSAARRAGLQGVLVGAEIVVAVLLVTGATLFTRSVGRLYDIDLGLEPEGVGAVTLVAGAGDLSSAELGQLYPRIVERIAALPGVRSAGLTVRLPLRDGGYQGPAEIESRPDLEGPRRPNVYWRSLTPGYFATLGIEVLDGRDLTDADRADAPQVALVNERFAREMWPGESALGKRVYHRGFDAGYVSIVGVVEDVPITGVRAEVPRVLYRPAAQASLTFPVQHVVFRTSGDPAALFPSVRTVVRQMDPRLAVTHPTTLEQVASSSIGDVLQLRFFLSALGGLALVVGCVGVYGVVSYSVSRRRAEYGVRMALGADAKRVVVGVLKREMLPIVLGTLGGLTAALLSARAVASLVWGVRPWDPASLATGAAVLLVVGLAAAFVPALRASDVSPSDALRRE